MKRRHGCMVLAGLGILGGGGLGCAGVGAPLLVVGALYAEVQGREVDDPTVAAPGRHLSTEAGRLHVQTWGVEEPEPDLPWVVLVHGSGAWSGVWEPVAVGLEARGLRVMALDLPPFGYSERPFDPAYDRRSQAARIWAAVDAMGVDDVVLVGHSYGGGPVAEAALAEPERTRGVVLLAGALSLEGSPTSTWVRGPFAWLFAATFTQPQLLPMGLRAMVHDDRTVTDAWVRRYARPQTVTGTTSAVADWVPELLAPTPCASLDPASYRDMATETLLVAGGRDTVTPPAQLEYVDELLPHSTLVVLPDVGHLPLVEDPDAVVGQVDGFVRGL